jgi:hypothetical protein
LGANCVKNKLIFLASLTFTLEVKNMPEKQSSFPNVSLGGKLNKQKGEKHAGNLRYREKDQSDQDKSKK